MRRGWWPGKRRGRRGSVLHEAQNSFCTSAQCCRGAVCLPGHPCAGVSVSGRFCCLGGVEDRLSEKHPRLSRTCPASFVSRTRVAAWMAWLAARRAGSLMDEPVVCGESPSSTLGCEAGRKDVMRDKAPLLPPEQAGQAHELHQLAAHPKGISSVMPSLSNPSPSHCTSQLHFFIRTDNDGVQRTSLACRCWTD